MTRKANATPAGRHSTNTAPAGPAGNLLKAEAMKHSLLALLLAPVLAMAQAAGPALEASPWPSTGVQPDTVSLSVNGTADALACVLTTTAAGKTPKCNLASLPVGSHTLVMVAKVAAKCDPQTSPAICTQAGSASSAPFALTLRSGAVAAPQGLSLVAN